MRLLKSLCALAVALLVVIVVCLTGFQGDKPELGLSIYLILLALVGIIGSVAGIICQIVWRMNTRTVTVFFLTLLLAAVFASIYLDKIVVYLHSDRFYK